MRHCRYCGNSGHNRRTCPSRPAHVKESDNKYHNMYRRKRTCRYCRQTDHDKRKCGKLITDRNEWIVRNAEYRKRFLEEAKREGYGVGAIVKRASWSNENYCLVISINWDAITVDNNYNYAIRGSGIGEDNQGENTFSPPTHYGIPEGPDREYYLKYSNDNCVVNPAPAESIQNSIPPNWLSGECRIDNLPMHLR